MQFYDSRSLYYKYPFGAVAENTPIVFRVCDSSAAFVNLLLEKDGGEIVRYPMQKQSFTGDFSEGIVAPGVDEYEIPIPSGEWWEVQIGPIPSGLYFYHFETDRGEMTKNGQKWQQTVYKAGYQTPDWIYGGLYYQIFPDRFFKDKEPEKINDRWFANWEDTPCYTPAETGAFPRVITNDYFGGTLSGIEKKLSYLKELSVTCIYLNPIFEAHSNHRYNTADYMKIDPTLGTEEDFKRLCKSAAALGIKIILDGVFSHTGSDSIYFNKEKRYGSSGAYNDNGSPYYEWYTFQNWPDEYTGWWGYKTLPETKELSSFGDFICGEEGVIHHWMGLGASGFRLDVADELPGEFIHGIRAAVKRENPDGLLIGEVWEDASNKISYSRRREFLLGDELDSVMNYPFMEHMKAFIKGQHSGGWFIDGVLDILEHYPKQTAACMMNLLGTHDTERILTAIAGEECGGRDRAWQAEYRLNPHEREMGEALLGLVSLLQYTLPGVPCLYYGNEIALEGRRDPFNRGSFDWLKTDSKLTDWYRFLGVLRKKCPALCGGDFLPAQSGDGYVSYIRRRGKDELFVAVNRSEKPVDIWLLTGWEKEKVLLGDLPQGGILTLGPKSCAALGRGEWTKEVSNCDNI